MLSLGKRVQILKKRQWPKPMPSYALWRWDVIEFLERLPRRRIFDLVVTSPPYNLGRESRKRSSMQEYLDWQRRVIQLVVPRVKTTGSICWQVGNFVENGAIEPLDVMLHPMFVQHDLRLRNRIIWRFGHGLHCRHRFSGRHEIILWYTRDADYIFNLDAVRIPPKYPGKRSSNGPNAGRYSSNPLGKNPEDVWDIPNVRGNTREKTIHPCQFPVGLVERLVLALTNRRGLVFDPFCGVGSAGIAAAANGRRFWGCDIQKEYVLVAEKRIQQALDGKASYRPHDQQIFDHRKSTLSRVPEEFRTAQRTKQPFPS